MRPVRLQQIRSCAMPPCKPVSPHAQRLQAALLTPKRFEQRYSPAVLPDRWGLIHGASLLYCTMMFQPSSRCFLCHWLPRKTVHSSCVRKRAKRRKKDCDVMTKCFKWTRPEERVDSEHGFVLRWQASSPRAALAASLSDCYSAFPSSLSADTHAHMGARIDHWLDWTDPNTIAVRKKEKKGRTSRIRMVLVVVRGKKGGGWKCLMWSPVYYNYLLYAPLSASHWAFLPQRKQHLESFAVDCDFF